MNGHVSYLMMQYQNPTQVEILHLPWAVIVLFIASNAVSGSVA